MLPEHPTSVQMQEQRQRRSYIGLVVSFERRALFRGDQLAADIAIPTIRAVISPQPVEILPAAARIGAETFAWLH
jgi:hypothetical protein